MSNKEYPPHDNAAIVDQFIDQMMTVRRADRVLGVSYVAVLATLTALHIIFKINNVLFLAPTLVITYGIAFRQAVISKVIYDAEKLAKEVKKPFNRYSPKLTLSEANENRYQYLQDYYAKKFKVITELWMLDSLLRRWQKIERTLAQNQTNVAK